MTKELEVFQFLDKLQRSGKTNMLGSIPYIVEEFYISKNEAKKFLVNWLKNKKNG